MTSNYEKLTALGLMEYAFPIIPPDAILHNSSTLSQSDLGKIPGKYLPDKKVWVGLKNWSNHTTTTKDIEEWMGWPEHAIGIRLGDYGAFDIDVDDSDLAKQVLECLPNKNTLTRTREGSPRTVLLYKTEGSFGKSRRAVFENGSGMIEFLGKGSQVVIVGQHKSGAYQSIEGEPALITSDQVDEIFNSFAQKFGVAETLTKPKLKSKKVYLSKQSRSYEEMVFTIKNWRADSGRHDALLDLIWGRVRDTGVKAAQIDAGTYMESVPEDKRDATWKRYYTDIPRMVAGAVKKNVEKAVEGGVFTVAEYEPVEWHVYGYFPKNTLIITAGKQGGGKSTLAAYTAACITGGMPWPVTGEIFPKMNVGWLTAEEVPKSEIYARVELNDGDPTRIKFLENVRHISGKDRLLDINVDVDYLCRVLKTYRIEYLVVDTITSFMGNANQNSPGDIRNCLINWGRVAMTASCIVNGLTHLNKDQSGNMMNDITGASAFTQVPRVVFGLVQDKSNGYFYYGLIKANLTQMDGNSICYKQSYKPMLGDDVNAYGVLEFDKAYSVESVQQVYLRLSIAEKNILKQAKPADMATISIMICDAYRKVGGAMKKSDVYKSTKKKLTCSAQTVGKNKFEDAHKAVVDSGQVERVFPEDAKRSEYWYEITS